VQSPTCRPARQASHIKNKMGQRLGQHFLTSQGAINAIIKAADLKPTDTVLEVGPGRGILTEALLESGAHVVAIEKDEKLAEFLKSIKFVRFIKSDQLEIICGDILNFDPRLVTNDSGLTTRDYKIIANIPYYITGQFLRKFLESEHPPTKMVLMLQKEVAERIVAKNSKESILSISVKAFGEPHYIQTVKAGSFNPPPKVDSAIILIDKISGNNLMPQGDVRSPTSHIERGRFFEIVKRGFASKRKYLKNNLDLTTEELAACGVPEKTRAEELSLEQWKCLAAR
jgi:16S rRNA (adenine1518-N6/adenine1519-N6)-dimethyltransferase